jgi:hypothetical protein
MPDRRACLAALYSCLAAGADVNASDSRGCTALQLAAGNQNAAAASKAICMLVEEGADVRAKCPNSGLEALHIVAGNSRNPMAAAAAAVQALVAQMCGPGIAMGTSRCTVQQITAMLRQRQRLCRRWWQQAQMCGPGMATVQSLCTARLQTAMQRQHSQRCRHLWRLAQM